MAKRYFLGFLIRGQQDAAVFEVRQEESTRLGKIIDNRGSSTETEFFWFKTIDGKSVILNLSDVQAFQFLWEPAAFIPDLLIDEGGVIIKLRGRVEPVETYPAEPDQLYDLFSELQHGPTVVPYPSFIDQDGERLTLNANEVVWIIAPTVLLEEGLKIIIKTDGLVV